MEKFAVIAKNSMLKQINYIDDLAYACEMYRYLIAEADFPDVKFMDNETGVVLMHYKKETTTYEYIDPDLLASLSNQTAEVDIDEAINLAETSIEPNGIDEETALRTECATLIEKLVAVIPRELADNIMKIYNRLAEGGYDIGTLKHLLKTLKEIENSY